MLDVNSDLIYGQKLESLKDVASITEVTRVYLGIDKNIVNVSESDNDFRYISDALPKKPFFPATLCKLEFLIAINFHDIY